MQNTAAMTELNETNAELAAFLGESPENALIPVEELEEQVEQMQVQALKGLTDDEEEQIELKIQSFIEKVKEDPNNLMLSSMVYKLGESAANIAMIHIPLYDKLVSEIMHENEQGNDAEGSKNYNLLRLKQELDLVNPAVLAKTPIKQKFLMFLSKTELPGTDKIMELIYKRKETVQSTINGIKMALLQNASDLDQQLADLLSIYQGLLASHKSLKQEIYIAQRVYNEVQAFLQTQTDTLVTQNLEALLADLTTQVNALLVEENMNVQFFSGSQLTAKLVREQQNQIRILVRQMEKAVLANLGLRVVAKGLENSVNQTKALGSVIASTIADTATTNEQTSDKLTKARTEGYIDLKKLQEGVDALERTFDKEAKANALIIKQGLVVSKNVQEATKRLEARLG